MSPHLTDPDAVRIAQGHLFARVSPPDRLGPSERWAVDLSVPRFTVTWGALSSASGPCQLLAVDDARGLHWGWAVPEQPPAATAALLATLERDPDLAGLLQTRRVDGDPDAVLPALALHLGFDGAWPAPVDGRIAWLAVRLTHHLGQPVPRPGWCTWCGRSAVEVPLTRCTEHTALCRSCADHLVDLLRLEVPTGADPGAVPCLRCRGTGPRIFGAFNAVCVSCIQELATDAP